MNVIKYLEEHSIEKLKEEFSITVREYDDRYALNYNQIESPRFHPIVDECRGLILDKDFNVLCRSFQRFYNLGEGTNNKGFSVRTPSFEGEVIKEMKIEEARILHKMDGSLINFYYDYINGKWQHATRGTAFAEGDTGFDITFSKLVEKAESYESILEYLNGHISYTMGNTFIFELTSPYNRIVTPYDKIELTLLAIKCNENGEEANPIDIADIADSMGCPSPKAYSVSSFESLLELVENFPSLQEGVVLSWFDSENYKINRLKLKNTKYCAIHNMRSNGQISPKRVLILVGNNEQHEYLSYFEDDKPFFDLVQNSLDEYKKVNLEFYSSIKDIEEQKDFALKVQANKDCHPALLFQLRKGSSYEDIIKKQLDNISSFANVLKLKEKFKEQLGIEFEE
jgi:hypothetical protein